ncbi:MAG: lipocalin family protein [Candidatus Symbiothrix sp.]|jgi:hypothetical protein|nr:lipocalin family protein [Candidatus Symbiothrix sp.]
MKNTFSSIIALLLLFGFYACEEKNEAAEIESKLAGTWQLSSAIIDGIETDISVYPDFIRFQTNKIFLSYNSTFNELIRGGWSYEGAMLNISTDLPAAYYVLRVDENYLSLKRNDFNTDGGLIATVRNYQRTEDSQILE